MVLLGMVGRDTELITPCSGGPSFTTLSVTRGGTLPLRGLKHHVRAARTDSL